MPDRLTVAQRRLDAARAKRRRLALGPPLAQSDVDLDALSTAGPERMPEVAAFVRDAAGQRGVDMLDAQPWGSV